MLTPVNNPQCPPSLSRTNSSSQRLLSHTAVKRMRAKTRFVGKLYMSCLVTQSVCYTALIDCDRYIVCDISNFCGRWKMTSEETFCAGVSESCFLILTADQFYLCGKDVNLLWVWWEKEMGGKNICFFLLSFFFFSENCTPAVEGDSNSCRRFDKAALQESCVHCLLFVSVNVPCHRPFSTQWPLCPSCNPVNTQRLITAYNRHLQHRSIEATGIVSAVIRSQLISEFQSHFVTWGDWICWW